MFIRDHREEFPISLMCEVIGVSRGGYYSWLRRPESKRNIENRNLKTEIRSIHAQSKRIYGSPKVYEELKDRGIRCSLKRVTRLMREDGLYAKTTKKFKATTNSRHSRPVAENILERKFNQDAPNKAWVSDITYIPTREGWLYLSTVIDLYSRSVVGWGMKERMTTQLVTDAFNMALMKRTPPLIHHSDRGSQYASDEFQKLLREHGVQCSMSGKGNCYDNAVAESFFGTLKKELVYFEDYKTRDEAKRSIFEYIEIFYNRKRRHSSLGYKSPVEFEKLRMVA